MKHHYLTHPHQKEDGPTSTYYLATLEFVSHQLIELYDSYYLIREVSLHRRNFYLVTRKLTTVQHHGTELHYFRKSIDCY